MTGREVTFDALMAMTIDDYNGPLLRPFTDLIDDGGTYGDQISWTVKGTKLTVSGEGNIPDTNSIRIFSLTNETVSAWHKYRDLITEIEIGEGITGIGDKAFLTYHSAWPEDVNREFSLHCSSLNTVNRFNLRNHDAFTMNCGIDASLLGITPDESGTSYSDGHGITGSLTLQHDWKYVSDNNADCTKDGTKHQECTVCRRKGAENIIDEGSRKEHTPEVIPAVPATCTEAGCSEGSRCSVCQTVLTEPQEIPPAGHQYTDVAFEWTEDRDSGPNIYYGAEWYSWGAAGSASCDVCQESLALDTTTNTYTPDDAGGEPGKIIFHAVCGLNGTEFTEDKVIVLPAHEHTWGPAVYTWSEDCSTVTAQRTCQFDLDHVESETVAATSVITTEAGCESAGLRTFTSNAFSNPAFVKQTKTQEIPPAGHQYTNVVFEWTEDRNGGIPNTYDNIPWYSWCAVGKAVCSGCGHTETLSTTTKTYTQDDAGGEPGKIIFLAYSYLNDGYVTEKKILTLKKVEEPDLGGNPTDESGTDDSGTDGSGKEDPGKDDPGKEAPGKDDSGKDDSDAQAAKKAEAQAAFALNVKNGAKDIPIQRNKRTTAIRVVSLADGDELKSAVSGNKKVAEASVSGRKIVLVGRKNRKKAKITVTTKRGAVLCFTVKVQKSAVRTKKLSVKKKLTLKVKGKVRLLPVITPVTSSDKLTFTSSNRKIASVGKKNGWIKAKKRGRVKITVKSGKKKKTVTVRVK